MIFIYFQRGHKTLSYHNFTRCHTQWVEHQILLKSNKTNCGTVRLITVKI